MEVDCCTEEWNGMWGQMGVLSKFCGYENKICGNGWGFFYILPRAGL